MNRIRETRFRKRITQIKLFTKTNIWPSRISYIEHDYVHPSEEEKRKLAGALRVKKDWLFPEENSKQGNIS